MPHVQFIGPDGREWPSATTLTALLPKEWLWAWYKRSVEKEGWAGWLRNNAKSEAGKLLGTAVHGNMERLIKDKEAQLDEADNAHLLAKKMHEVVGPMIEDYVAVEPHLVSKRLRIHGSADIIVRRVYEPGLWIGDYKTSYKKDITHPIQLAVYALCWNEYNPDRKIDQGFIARIDKDSKNYNVKIDEYKGLSRYRPLIIALRRVWGYAYEKESKKSA